MGFVIIFFLVSPLRGQDSNEDSNEDGNKTAISPEEVVVNQVLASTEMDQPGEHHESFGIMPDSEVLKTLKRLSKVDMDADLNYDGSINNQEESDQGFREHVPPGLQLGVGELTKLVIRFKTYDSAFPGHLYVTLETAGINRLSVTGKYSSDREELDSCGRIRVWNSPKKEELLLDSGDSEKRSFVWKVGNADLGLGLTGEVPRVVYVEGMEKSKKFAGDIRLLISASHSLDEGENRSPSGTYLTAYDHILFTVSEKPIEKSFINNNAEGVWPELDSEE